MSNKWPEMLKKGRFTQSVRKKTYSQKKHQPTLTISLMSFYVFHLKLKFIEELCVEIKGLKLAEISDLPTKSSIIKFQLQKKTYRQNVCS